MERELYSQHKSNRSRSPSLYTDRLIAPADRKRQTTPEPDLTSFLPAQTETAYLPMLEPDSPTGTESIACSCDNQCGRQSAVSDHWSTPRAPSAQVQIRLKAPGRLHL